MFVIHLSGIHISNTSFFLFYFLFVIFYFIYIYKYIYNVWVFLTWHFFQTFRSRFYFYFWFYLSPNSLQPHSEIQIRTSLRTYLFFSGASPHRLHFLHTLLLLVNRNGLWTKHSTRQGTNKILHPGTNRKSIYFGLGDWVR